MNDIARNLADVRSRMAESCHAAGRPPQAAALVAVSKKQPVERISAALEAGQRLFGENRVQEAQDHWSAFKTRYPDIRLHLIGSLQTNKAAEAVALFDVIETLDREKLADALAAEMQKQRRDIPCYIQVNTGAEEQKGGVLPNGLEALYAYARKAGINVTGLMCIPPVDDNPVFHFGLLATWARRLGLSDISMGMSADYEAAIRMGATHVRVGSALFGDRTQVK